MFAILKEIQKCANILAISHVLSSETFNISLMTSADKIHRQTLKYEQIYLNIYTKKKFNFQKSKEWVLTNIKYSSLNFQDLPKYIHKFSPIIHLSRLLGNYFFKRKQKYIKFFMHRNFIHFILTSLFHLISIIRLAITTFHLYMKKKKLMKNQAYIRLSFQFLSGKVETSLFVCSVCV